MGCFKIFINNVRDFVLRFDMFAANATLRSRQQTSYESFGCGLVSLVMVGVFIGIFAQQIINVLTKTQVQSTVNLQDLPDSTESIEGINFAIGIDRTTLTEIQGYFTFQLAMISNSAQIIQPTVTVIQLTRCTQQIWKGYGEQLSSYYRALHLQDMYCLPLGTNTTLYGYQGSGNQNLLKLSISKCYNPMHPQLCKSDAQINTFFDGLGYIPVRLLFVNKIISPSNNVPVTTTLERGIFLSFSSDLGNRGEITLGRYQIQTDQSIWPFTQIQYQTGHYIEDFQSYTVGIKPTESGYNPQGSRNNNYIDVIIRKSTLIYNVSRVHQKIDDLLSYIGGLFSLIFFVVFFMFGSFNEYRYELRVAEASFSDQSKNKIGENDMGYCTYFIYSIYDWLKMVGINMPWKKMQKIDEVRQEANEQLDVCYLVKKIRYFDRCIQLLMQKSHRMASYLIDPITIDQSRKDRKLLQYYDKTISDFNKIDQNKKSKENKYQQQVNSALLPVEHKRKVQTLSQINVYNDILPQMSNQNIRDFADKKQNKISRVRAQSQQKSRKKRCEQIMQDQYDEQDEQAETILFKSYKEIVQDQSKIAAQIKQQIHSSIQNCMYSKIVKGSSHNASDFSKTKTQGIFIELEI